MIKRNKIWILFKKAYDYYIFGLEKRKKGTEINVLVLFVVQTRRFLVLNILSVHVLI